jgi:prepilin-type N-terminal cleavage/methylation domain-containing protein
MGRLLARMRSEAGMTLPELLVAMSLLAIVSVVFLSVLVSMQRSVARNAEWSRNNDEARLGVEAIDRHIRSGNVLYSPVADGSSLVVHTQSNAPTIGERCIQWQIIDRELQARWWRPQPGPQDPTAWRTVAEGVVNYVVSPEVPAFSIDPDPDKGNRMIGVVLLVNGAYEAHPNQTVRIQVGVTGRNTSYGYLTSRCDPIPA